MPQTRLLLLALLFFLPLETQNKSHVTWHPSSLSQTIFIGTSSFVDVAFTSERDLQDVTLSVVPELASIVSVEPSTFQMIKAGEAQTVRITFSVADNAEVQTLLGTIHVKQGSKTIARPLPVSVQIQTASAPVITVDGNPDDWAGITPTLVDPEGDAPFDLFGNYRPDNDILAISITNDEEKAYFLIEYAAVPSMGATALFLDTDLDPNTGCTVLVGTEYIMLFLAADLQPPTGVFTLGDNRDCSASGTDFPGAIQFATQGRFVEASVTRESLRALTPSTTGFRIWGETVLNVEASTLEFVFPPAEYIYK